MLFADIVGFTSLAERTDPEVVAHMIDATFRKLGDIVAEHGGTVDKYLGDAVMAVFGVPSAHGDDAERAVAAGLAMRELGGDLAFSIGINSGEVVVTELGRPGDDTVIGDAVNVAARLEEVAAPGEVLCGPLTVELARGAVSFRERTPVLLKGKGEPVEVWEALSLFGGDRSTVGDEPMLVGREDELAFLEGQWRRTCRDRQPSVVVLCGEAGSGKTRLMNELGRLAATDGAVVRASHPSYGAMGAARVASDVVGQLGPADSSDVEVRLRSLTGDVDPSLRAMDPSALRHEQRWAFRRLLHQRTAHGPLLVLVDDMHRACDEVLDLFAELGRLHDVPVLTVMAGRSEPGEWQSAVPATATLRLRPLGREEVVALATSLVGGTIAPDALAVLIDRSNGSPLYLRELVAVAKAEGSLEHGIDGFRLTERAVVPASLQGLLVARLDALGPGPKLAFQHAAVLGDAASSEEIGALGSEDAAASVAALAAGGLLRADGDGRYDVVDPLLREVAYEMLPRSVRGELHRRAAGIVAGFDEQARHLDRAADFLHDDPSASDEAIASLMAAARTMLVASRHREALELFERAMARGCRAPDVLLELARLQTMVPDAERAAATLAFVEDDPDDPRVAVERDHIAANTKVFSDPAWALARLEDVVERWRRLGDDGKVAWALANSGVAWFFSSRIAEAGRALEEAYEHFDRVGDRFGQVSTSSFLCLAKPTDPRVPGWLADALQFADETGDRSRQLTSLSTLAWNHFFRALCGGPDDVATAVGFTRRLTELAEELGSLDMALHGWSLLCFLMRMSGQLEAAVSCASELRRVMAFAPGHQAWLSQAACFMVAVAEGDRGAVVPGRPGASPDPVVAMAGVVVDAELAMAGRIVEALADVDGAGPPDLGPIGDLAAVFHAMTLVLAGRGTAALPRLHRAVSAARRLDAPAVERAALALQAEVEGDVASLGSPPARARSIADVLVLRSHAVAGDRRAAEALAEAVGRMAVPGLGLDTAGSAGRIRAAAPAGGHNGGDARSSPRRRR